MGIADKDLSEELQVRSEQPQEVECKCLVPLSASRGLCTQGPDRTRPQDRVANIGSGGWRIVECRPAESQSTVRRTRAIVG